MVEQQSVGRPLEPRDDFPHATRGEHIWLENFWLTFHDPATDVQGVLYGSYDLVRPGFVRAFVIQGGRTLFQFSTRERFAPQVEAGRVAIGPATFDCLSPFHAWSFQFDDGDVHVSLDWQASIPPYTWNWAALTSSEHVEQSGTVRGTVRIGADEMIVDGYGQRDRAWGPRQSRDFRRGWSSRAFGTDGTVLHASIIDARGHNLLFGYYAKSGSQPQPLDSLTLAVHRREAGGPPERTHLHAVTAAGDDLEYDVSLRFADAAHGRGDVASTMYYTLGEWTSDRHQMIGQLDSWWVGDPRSDETLHATGNAGALLTDLWPSG